jgi:hypothetical protein
MPFFCRKYKYRIPKPMSERNIEQGKNITRKEKFEIYTKILIDSTILV